MRTGLAIPASQSSIKPLSLNRVDTAHNDYTKLLGQFPELTRPTTGVTATNKTVGFYSQVYHGHKIRERQDKFRR